MSRSPSCDCTSESGAAPKQVLYSEKGSTSCDSACVSDAASKPELRPRRSTTSCDCTSESSAASKPESRPRKSSISCDCTSESDAAPKPELRPQQSSTSCDCTNESNTVPNQALHLGKRSTEKSEVKPQYSILEVQVSKTVLNLLSSTSSSCSCDDTSQNLDESRQENLGNLQCPTIIIPDNKTANNTNQRIDAIIVQDDDCADKIQLKCSPVIIQEHPRSDSDCLSSCKCTLPSKSPLESPADSQESIQSQPINQLECTLALIKPDAIMFSREIELEMINAGFTICQRRWLKLMPEQASDFYRDNYKQENFAQLVSYMSSSSILAFDISKINAVEEWKSLIGPETVSEARIYAPDSIRGKYGRKGNDMMNAVHGSESRAVAEREIHFFFPDRTIEPLLVGESLVDYLWDVINETLSEGLIKCCEAKPDDPVIWLGNWLLENNTNRPQYLLRY